MVLVRAARHFGRTRRWAPAALNVVRGHQRRHNTPYMPWPFDQYHRPGAAKYWLSKSPATDEKHDEYEQDLVYLDELEARVHGAQANYQPSEKWQAAYNEYAWQDDLSVTETYGSIGGPTSSELREKYGRGRKIDVSHYINPRMYKHDRVSIPSPYVHPDLRKRLGPIKNLLQLPPEEPSAFKLWNPWTMLGATSIILVSKEWFLISHDFWHAQMFWMAWALICTVCCDWWAWWYALRGQEFYDLTYFPLNESTEKLFKCLDKLESRPHVAGVVAALHPYMMNLAERATEKKKADDLASAHNTAAEKIQMKLKEESGIKAQVNNQFKETAFQASLAAFASPDARKKYLESTLKLFATKAELKSGVAESKTDSTEFNDKYNAVYSQTEKDYFSSKRKEGTLPWVFASPEEINAQKMSPAQKQERYASKVQAFSAKYHKVALSKSFA